MEETKPKSRVNRTKRDVESRATQERPKQWKAPEILPEIDKEDGYSYRFVRTSTMGVPDAKNVSAKFREGWEPVKASEHPEAMAMVNDLRENHGIFCSIVVYPVIPKGLIILRLIPTATHTKEDIDETITAFSAIRKLLENGTYKKIAASIV